MAAISQSTKGSNSPLLNCAVFIGRITFWMACIVFGFLCLVPAADLPSGLFDWWDKAQHVFAFFCLSSMGILVYQQAVGRVAIGLTIYGGLIEIFQWLTEWRYGDLSDWFADSIGTLFGSFFVNTLISIRSNWPRSNVVCLQKKALIEKIKKSSNVEIG